MAKLKALVIDDDPDYTDLIRIRLTSWGHETTVAHNWLSAMMLMMREDYDVMLLDVETPTGNGLTACRDMCDVPKVASTAKVFITGCSDPDTRQRCRELNADYINKSSNVFDELQKKLEAIQTKLTPAIS